MTQLAIITFIFVKYIPENGQKCSNDVEGILCDCILLYLVAIQLLELIL